MKLEQEELEVLQELQKSFASIKMQIGEVELQKSVMLTQANAIRQQFAKVEGELINKYGENAIINMQTGEVTQKTE